jgi:hypothetical protein
MNFLGYRVLFGVYKSWLYTPKKKKTKKKKKNSGGPDFDTDKLFWGSPCYWDKKLVDPRRTQLPGMHSIAPPAMARRESATSS